MIYIDVGGFEGNVVDMWLKEGIDKIYTLEPNPVLYEFLKKKYSKFKNVTVLPIALWNESCTKDFYISENPCGSSLHGKKRNLLNPKIIKVECVRATEFINNFDDDIFLYLNCEGAEFEIMEDLIETGAYRKIKKFKIGFHQQEHRLNCLERYKNLISLIKEKGIKIE